MKNPAKTLLFILTLALIISVLVLSAPAAEDPTQMFEDYAQPSESLARLTEDNPTAQNQSPNAASEPDETRQPQGHYLGADLSNAPALRGDIRIPRLEAAPEIVPIQDDFLPPPYTGR